MLHSVLVGPGGARRHLIVFLVGDLCLRWKGLLLMLLHSSHVAVVARVVLLSHVLSYSSSFESWGGRGIVGLYLVDVPY